MVHYGTGHTKYKITRIATNKQIFWYILLEYLLE